MLEAKIHKVEVGPLGTRDFPTEYAIELEEAGVEAVVEVLTEEGGKYPLAKTIVFDSHDAAYKFCNYLKTHIGPVIISSDGEFQDSEGNELDFYN